MDACADAYDQVVDRQLLLCRYNLSADCVLPKEYVDKEKNADAKPVQLNLFTNYELETRAKQQQDIALDLEYDLQKVIIDVKNKFGKNALMRGMSLIEGATMKERNAQIGGHKA